MLTLFICCSGFVNISLRYHEVKDFEVYSMLEHFVKLRIGFSMPWIRPNDVDSIESGSTKFLNFGDCKNSVADPDQGSGALLTLDPDPGSGSNNPDNVPFS